MWLAISHFICNDDDGNSGKHCRFDFEIQKLRGLVRLGQGRCCSFYLIVLNSLTDSEDDIVVRSQRFRPFSNHMNIELTILLKLKK
jgi:hypothetical protein